jgi:hypothetical protein
MKAAFEKVNFLQTYESANKEAPVVIEGTPEPSSQFYSMFEMSKPPSYEIWSQNIQWKDWNINV